MSKYFSDSVFHHTWEEVDSKANNRRKCRTKCSGEKGTEESLGFAEREDTQVKYFISKVPFIYVFIFSFLLVLLLYPLMT